MVVVKISRRELQRRADAALDVRPAVQAALNNERLDRMRIEGLESILLHRGFRGRLRWLLTGK
jgi:hypothetical protein